MLTGKNRGHAPPYAWSHDERRVAFVVSRRAEPTRETKLVVVEIDNDGGPVSRKVIGLPEVSCRAPFREIGFVGGSVRLVRGDDDHKLIRSITLD